MTKNLVICSLKARVALVIRSEYDNEQLHATVLVGAIVSRRLPKEIQTIHVKIVVAIGCVACLS